MRITIISNCPFCAGKARLSSYDPYGGYQGDCTSYIIKCSQCGANIKHRNESEVLRRWNTRVQKVQKN
jgi:C4-type Zn-finger protein